MQVGLNSVSRNWYFSSHKHCFKGSGKHQQIQGFMRYDNGLQEIFKHHVDEFLWLGTVLFENRIINNFH